MRDKLFARMRFLLVGYGRWGKIHERHLRQRVDLVGIVDPSSAKDVAGDSTTPIFRELESALRALTPFDAAVIATPASTHTVLAKRILETGAHVLVEKPVSLSLEDFDDLQRIANGQGSLVMSGHLLQFSPAIQALATATRQGQLGRKRSITATRHMLGSIRLDANVIWNVAPHDVSCLLLLERSAVSSVRAMAIDPLNTGQLGAAWIEVAFESGCVGRISVDWFAPVPDRKIVVVGDAGIASIDWLRTEDAVSFGKYSLGKPANTMSALELKVDWSEPLRTETVDLVERQLIFFLEVMAGASDLKQDQRIARETTKVLELANSSIADSSRQIYSDR